MFSKACTDARKWTQPMIVSTRCLDGTVNGELATFFYINKQGWALTSGHVFDSLAKFKDDQKKIQEANQMDAQNPGRVRRDPKWITNHSVWYGMDTIMAERIHVLRGMDLALVKLNNCPPIESTPVFRDPRTIVPGTSLCRMGFPFATVKNEFIPEKNAFKIAEGVLPLTFFPNEGIHTRNVLRGKSLGDMDNMFLEMSSPGLRGQSGGPVFDTRGRICGVQSATESLDMNFHPSVNYEGAMMVENQFLNLGLATHCKSIIDALRYFKVPFEMDTASESDIVENIPVASSKAVDVRNIDVGTDGDKYIID